jgi:hypothetical protein
VELEELVIFYVEVLVELVVNLQQFQPQDNLEEAEHKLLQEVEEEDLLDLQEHFGDVELEEQEEHLHQQLSVVYL